MSSLNELYQEVILDHAKRPRNFGELADAVHVHGDNPSCGDEIFLHVKFDDDRVADIKFTGHGCAISQASASLMTLKLKGKSRAEAEAMRRDFEELVTSQTPLSEPPKTLGDLRLLAGVLEFPQRVKCAMLAWRAFEQALTPQSSGSAAAEVSTETPS
jgi:nitrogen fixation NifU-like protein